MNPNGKIPRGKYSLLPPIGRPRSVSIVPNVSVAGNPEYKWASSSSFSICSFFCCSFCSSSFSSFSSSSPPSAPSSSVSSYPFSSLLFLSSSLAFGSVSFGQGRGRWFNVRASSAWTTSAGQALGKGFCSRGGIFMVLQGPRSTASWGAVEASGPGQTAEVGLRQICLGCIRQTMQARQKQLQGDRMWRV